MSENAEKPTMSVPEAGKHYFNLSRWASYEAAKRGQIPTIRIGRLIRVPVRAMEQMLDKVFPANCFAKSTAPRMREC
jgi:hypothetical protein